MYKIIKINQILFIINYITYSQSLSIMNPIQISNMRQKTSILDKSISKGKGEINMNCFALMFSELVQYCQGKAHTVNELQMR